MRTQEQEQSRLLPGYTSQQNRIVGIVVDKLSLKLGGEVPVKFGAILICYNQPEAPNDVHKEALFRVKAAKIQTEEFLIDRKARVYRDWDSFLKTNQIPDSNMCVPINGAYSLNCNGFLQLDFVPSANGLNLLKIIREADGLFYKVLDDLKQILAGTAVVDLGVKTVDLTFWNELQLTIVLDNLMGIILLAVATWCLIKSLIILIDHVQHEQSLDITKAEGLENWKTILVNLKREIFDILFIIPFKKLFTVSVKYASDRVKQFLNILQQCIGSNFVLILERIYASYASLKF